MNVDWKGLGLRALFGRWGRGCRFEEGYTILLPSPMDMPFLLRYALEGLLRIDTANCKQILVVPDGHGDDGGAALRAVADSFDDPRIEVVGLGPLDRRLVRMFGNSAATHWLAAVNGTTHARCGHAFLHDSDAFFLDPDGLERQYRECRDRGMFTLGVTARIDPDFVRRGYRIPGTWELMYSTRWARSRPPSALKGRKKQTESGEVEFDSMLYPQFLDYPSGKVGVMDDPPRLVHYNGTIVTYRVFRDRAGTPVVDELFRLLLLAILADLDPAPDGMREVPTVGELAAGLDDPSAPVTYGSRIAVQEYPIFREMVDQMCESPIMQGPRAERVRELIRPFDDHFAVHQSDPELGSLLVYRSSGLA